MRRRTLAYGLVAIIAGVAIGGIALTQSTSQRVEPTSNRGLSLAELARQTHFHGIAVDRSDASRVYLATHHGLYVVDPMGKATLISETRDDFMGFTAHPVDPSVLYASGHPARGGNLGFIASKDRGRSWTRLSDGVDGPVDFHQMDVSKADPSVIYGVYRGLQRSSDGGHSWTRAGPPPDGIIALAASSRDADTLYAATEQGLLRSTDAGRSWHAAHLLRRPATEVHVTQGGDIFAFMVGTGLIRASEDDLAWRVVSNDFGGDYILHFAADPHDGDRLYAVTFDPGSHAQAVLMSSDGGSTWRHPGMD